MKINSHTAPGTASTLIVVLLRIYPRCGIVTAKPVSVGMATVGGGVVVGVHAVNISSVPSSMDEEEYGFILFKIKSQSNLNELDTLQNTAEIQLNNLNKYRTNQYNSVFIGTNSLDNYSLDNGIKVFPNPSESQLFIKSDQLVDELSIINMKGEEVFYSDPVSKEIEIVHNLSSGMYILQLRSDVQVSYKKIVIQ